MLEGGVRMEIQEGVLLQSYVPAYATEELEGEGGVSQPPPPMGHCCV